MLLHLQEALYQSLSILPAPVACGRSNALYSKLGTLSRNPLILFRSLAFSRFIPGPILIAIVPGGPQVLLRSTRGP